MKNKIKNNKDKVLSIFIELDTLGSDPQNCAVVKIVATTFNVSSVYEFHSQVSIEANVTEKRVFCPRKIQKLVLYHKPYFDLIYERERIGDKCKSLAEEVYALFEWIERAKKANKTESIQIWASKKYFDLEVIQNIAEQSGIKVPYKMSDYRCLDTHIDTLTDHLETWTLPQYNTGESCDSRWRMNYYIEYMKHLKLLFEQKTKGDIT